MCEAVGHPVVRLVRTRIGPLADRTLEAGGVAGAHPGRGAGAWNVRSPHGTAAGGSGRARRAVRRSEPSEAPPPSTTTSRRTSHERIVELLDQMFERNGIDHDDLISILFTATDDLHSTFPAAGARKVGLGDVPLICARGARRRWGTPRCIRVMMHLAHRAQPRPSCTTCTSTARSRLRDDLPE